MVSMDLLKHLGRRSKDRIECRCTYINHNGQFSEIRLLVSWLWYGKREEYPDEQWFVDGVDLDDDDGTRRTFAVNDMGIKDGEVMK